MKNRVKNSKDDDEKKDEFMVNKTRSIRKSVVINEKVKMLEEVLMRKGQEPNGDNNQKNNELNYNENGSTMVNLINKKPINAKKRKKSRISFVVGEDI